ncbi:hypothetical protein SprV_0200985700 [Sparganum proliferum]
MEALLTYNVNDRSPFNMLLSAFSTGEVHSEGVASRYLLCNGLSEEENTCRKRDGPAIFTNKKFYGQNIPIS